MNERFKNCVELLDPLFQQPMAMEPVQINRLPTYMPTSGI
jgi:hypothetical protein